MQPTESTNSRTFTPSRARGKEFYDAPAGVVAPEDKRGDVNGMAGRADMRLERREGFLAVGEKLQGVAAERRRCAGRDGGLRDRAVDRLAVRQRRAGNDGEHGGLRARELAEFPAAEEQVERHADPRHQHDDEQPRKRARRRAFLAHQPGDEQQGEDEAGDGGQLGAKAAGEEAPEEFAEGFEHDAPREKRVARSAARLLKKTLAAGGASRERPRSLLW